MINDYADELTYTAGPPATSKQSIVGVAGTAIIGGKVKDGGAAGDWGAGCDYDVYLRVPTALVGATGGIQVDVVTDTAPGLATAPTVLATKTIPAASVTLNSLHYIGKIAAGTRKRYLGAKVTPLTTNSTAGEVIIGLKPCGAGPQNRVNSL
jgi:hypothetical protein